MSKVKSSSPLRRSADNKPKGKRIGCFVFVGIFLVGLIAAAVVFGLGLPNFFQNGQVATVPSGLNDNTSPEVMLARREKEEARLNSYAWLDKEAGVVRIPIDRAMALIAEGGLPVGSQGTEETTPGEELSAVTPASEVDSEAPAAVTPIAEESLTARTLAPLCWRSWAATAPTLPNPCTATVAPSRSMLA